MRTSKKTYDYSKLSRVLFTRGLIMTVFAASAVILFRIFSRGNFADAIVFWIAHTFEISYDSATAIYFSTIPGNMVYIIGIVIIVFMLMLFRMLLSSYTKYFDEVITGVSAIMTSRSGRIVLSPELKFFEDELNNVKDTLERRAYEAQQTEQQKNDLVVYLAHDIKTPLTSVIGYLSLLDENPDLPDALKTKYTRIAWEKANRLETLVNEFFEITRYNLQTIPLHKENTNLCYMMVQISDELYPSLVSHDKEILIDIEEDMSIFGDSEKLARVFNNVLKNAITYSDANSAIRISAEKRSGKTFIAFENSGAIPQDRIDLLFDKFYRLSSSRSSETGGAGLGLAIAKDIVTIHGGEIRAESGGGKTVFTVALPAS